MSGRQLLLVRTSQEENAYGRFALEILRAEGLNGFETVDMDETGFPDLQDGDLVVLSRCFLRNSEAEALRKAVDGGARLVCFHPPQNLAEAFGWKPSTRVLCPGWISVRAEYPGSGSPVQTHVPVSLHEPEQASSDVRVLADAVLPDWTAAGFPAATLQTAGRGMAAFFFYDLPKAVARVRFGNPDLASIPTSGMWRWTHAGDLFTGYLDDRVRRLPQADFHGQLLASVLTDVCAYPLARLWYYPQGRFRSAAVLQSDDDMSTPEQFHALADSLARHGGHATFYLMKKTLLSDDEVLALRRRGHTFAPHANPWGSKEPPCFSFPSILEEETALFKRRFGECSTSLQSHGAPWHGYMSWVPTHIRLGYRLLFAYLGLGTRDWNTYMCGSGRPLRFCDRDGTVHDCWQQPVVTFDDQSVEQMMRARCPELVQEFETLLRAAVEENHTAIPILSHPVSYATYSHPFMDAAMDALNREGVPIYNGDQWCSFLDRRDAVRIAYRPGDREKLSCAISHLSGTVSLMIPVSGNAAPRVAVDGKAAETPVVRRMGRMCALLDLEGRKDESRLEIDISEGSGS